jgi:hypothetical protein
MEIERGTESIRIVLSHREARLLRRALERASFIDTPSAEQPEIMAFCTQALEALPPIAP